MLFIDLLVVTIFLIVIIYRSMVKSKLNAVKKNPHTILLNDILREEHPNLRIRSEEVAFPLSAEEKQLADSMMQYIINSRDTHIAKKFKLRRAMGLSAPQINHSKRMFALYFKDERGKLVSFITINPEILSHSDNQIYNFKGESCLSVDRTIPGIVHRYAKITVRFFTVTGEEKVMQLSGIPAIAFQHELDHLNGVLFYDHIDKNEPFNIPENSRPVRRKKWYLM